MHHGPIDIFRSHFAEFAFSSSHVKRSEGRAVTRAMGEANTEDVKEIIL
jgi:hypothetical protein